MPSVLNVKVSKYNKYALSKETRFRFFLSLKDQNLELNDFRIKIEIISREMI